MHNNVRAAANAVLDWFGADIHSADTATRLAVAQSITYHAARLRPANTDGALFAADVAAAVFSTDGTASL